MPLKEVNLFPLSSRTSPLIVTSFNAFKVSAEIFELLSTEVVTTLKRG